MAISNVGRELKHDIISKSAHVLPHTDWLKKKEKKGKKKALTPFSVSGRRAVGGCLECGLYTLIDRSSGSCVIFTTMRGVATSCMHHITSSTGVELNC